MLDIIIPKQELWDEDNNKFIIIEPEILRLEHSLKSMSEWESKHRKPLMGKEKHTMSERLDYIRCMTTNDVKQDNVYLTLTAAQLKRIDKYMNDKPTATIISRVKQQQGSNRFVSAELIYCWMSTFNIPYIPCEEWHLNKLLTLIHVCSEENKGPQKIPKGEAMKQQVELNRLRRQHLGSTG